MLVTIKQLFQSVVALSLMLPLSGCYTTLGPVDPQTGLLNGTFPSFLKDGDRIDHAGTYTCKFGVPTFTLSLTERASGDALDRNYIYDMRGKLDENPFAESETKAGIAKMPESVRPSMTAVLQTADRDKVMTVVFRKRIGAPHIAQITNDKGQVMYGYFDFDTSTTFSILQPDYKDKRAAMERLATDKVKFYDSGLGTVALSGPNDDVQSIIENTTWDHLKILATCALA